MKTCWILTEGIAGTENQCLGIAEALGLTPVIKRAKLRFPWKQLSPWLPGAGLSVMSDSIDPPYPDLLIASGRKSIGAALEIKKKSGGKTFLVQVQDPRIDPERFDLVVVPQHDPARGRNVLVTTGALHRVTPQKLISERAKFEQTLSPLPHPRVAVMIGGSSRAHEMTRANTEKLALQLKGLNAGLMITASRRSGSQNIALLKEILNGDNVYFWDGTGENPYFAFLAMADHIIVTADSVSMASEAISTGKPVHIASIDGGAKRLNKFHALLQEQGYTRPFNGTLETWTYTPPADTKRVADVILSALS